MFQYQILISSHINTGVGFFKSYVNLVYVHSGLSLNIEAQGDIDVDDHHVTEDISTLLLANYL